MALIRLESRKDPRTGLYCVEIYNPAAADQPFVTPAPRYPSAAAAENDVIALIAAWTNDPSRRGVR